MNTLLWGLLGSLAAGSATSLGAFFVFFSRDFNRRLYAGMLSFAAGIMLAATIFSLLLPAMNQGGIYPVIIGFSLGVLFLELCDQFIPHEHFLKGIEGIPVHLRRISLFVLAITIHNFPEGLSVGVSFGTDNLHKALALTVGIAIQNILEGTAVALPLRSQGYSPLHCFLIASLTGLVEPIGGVLGAGLTVIFTSVMPIVLSFAAGCMLYVISGEIIPECHREHSAKSTKIWLIVGFILMMYLDNIFT